MPEPRLLQITSPLGEDALLATRLSVTEQVGLPYTIEVDVLAEDAQLKPSALMTQPITVTVARTVNGQTIERHFHGLVAEFGRLGPGPSKRTGYRLVAVPALWQLSLKSNCRIFQGKTVKEVTETLLSDHGLPAPTWGMLPALSPMPYCTQFNETDLHFLSRVLEEHGLGYYFSHAKGSHTLHISHSAQGFPMGEAGEAVASNQSPGDLDFSGWTAANRMRPASFETEDMDAQQSQPSARQKKKKDTLKHADEPAMWKAGKHFKWPGHVASRPGVDQAAVVMGQMESASEGFAARSRDPRHTAGSRINIKVRAEDDTDQAKQYVITTVRHQATDMSKLAAGSGGTEDYQCEVELASTERTWMPSPRHERPTIPGVINGLVTGPKGEQIHVDDYGRIKVWSIFNRGAPTDDNASIWMRVAQSVAGSWGGNYFIPRVGDEVLVAFLAGNPDYPVVIGSLYGHDALPPFQPGQHRARTGIKTRSYKSESSEDSNILRFEDKKGEEEVLLHAQKNLLVEVENDETRKIDHDQTETIKNNRTVTIEDGNDALTLKKGNGTQTYKMGNFTLKCELGAVTIEAMQSITLKVGGNSVTIDQKGITSKGILITEEASAMHKTKAPAVMVNGDATVMVQGGIVMLN